MRYRKLGNTGLEVSEVGLGGGGLGHIFGPATDEAVQDAVSYALEQGVTFFDVAPAYGSGTAERNLGQALAGRRDDLVIATKILLKDDDLADIPGAIERGLAESLERLGTDHVDVFQLHNMISRERGGVTQVTVTGEVRRSFGIDLMMGSGGVIDGMQRVKATGAARFIGFTGVGEGEAVREVMRSGAFDTVQVYYNLLNVTAAEPRAAGSTLHDHGQILPLAAELGMGAIGIRNIASGALAPPLDRDVPADSLTGRDLERAKRLEFLLHGNPVAQVAARVVLDHPAISTVVPGAKNRAELQDAVLGAELPELSADEHRRLIELAGEDFGIPEPEDIVM